MTSVRARRTTTTLLAAGLLPLALSACGVGLDPQTYRQRTTQDATNAQVGGLALRNVAIDAPTKGEQELAVGTDARLTLAVVNAGAEKDTLTGVTTAAASSIKLVDGSGQEVTSVEIPAKGSAEPDSFGVMLIGLTKALRPAMYVDVTFTFATNGSQKLSVPVRVYDTAVPRASYAPKKAEE